jgi:hypothetical protein
MKVDLRKARKCVQQYRSSIITSSHPSIGPKLQEVAPSFNANSFTSTYTIFFHDYDYDHDHDHDHDAARAHQGQVKRNK